MAERTTRTEIINLGNELITGKKSDKYGRLIEPTAEVIPISNNIKVIRRDGLPTTIKLQMKKKGFSDKKLKRLESAILMQSANKLDAASAYRNYSKSLQKLAASLKEWII